MYLCINYDAHHDIHCMNTKLLLSICKSWAKVKLHYIVTYLAWFMITSLLTARFALWSTTFTYIVISNVTHRFLAWVCLTSRVSLWKIVELLLKGDRYIEYSISKTNCIVRTRRRFLQLRTIVCLRKMSVRKLKFFINIGATEKMNDLQNWREIKLNLCSFQPDRALR